MELSWRDGLEMARHSAITLGKTAKSLNLLITADVFNKSSVVTLMRTKIMCSSQSLTLAECHYFPFNSLLFYGCFFFLLQKGPLSLASSFIKDTYDNVCT